MLWGVTSERIEEWLTSSGERTAVITGLAASLGVVEGRARVILRADQLGELEQGEVLVAPSTSPSWTPVFGKIVAAVSDIGGVMSHAAIVAREYGLPAVVGAAGATKRIKTGDRLRVDGDRGHRNDPRLRPRPRPAPLAHHNGVRHMAATAVVGRDGELGSIQAFLAEVEQGPAALVLSGEAGIGKTILWEAGVEEARERFGRVLSHRSVEAEASLAFAGLSDLLEPVLEEVAAALPPLRREALEVALLLAGPGEQPPDPRCDRPRLPRCSAAACRARRGPGRPRRPAVARLVVGSCRPARVAAAARRARRLPGHATDGRRSRVAVRARAAPSPTTTRRLSALPAESWRTAQPAARATRAGAGPSGARPSARDDRVATRSLQSSSAASSCARAHGRRRASRCACRRACASYSAAASRACPRRPGTSSLYAAALARPTVELIAAAHGYRGDVLEALDSAAQESVIEIDDSRVRFAHPLLASICYEQAPLSKRRAVHQALAGAVTDPEERARHLALAAEGPDADTASELDSAAELAAARGATAAAAELCELAADLTPDDPGRLDGDAFGRPSYHRLAGDRERATRLLERAPRWRCHPAWSGPTSSASSPRLVELTLRRSSRSSTRHWPRPSTTTRLCADSCFPQPSPAVRGDVPRALADGRAALERAERAA